MSEKYENTDEIFTEQDKAEVLESLDEYKPIVPSINDGSPVSDKLNELTDFLYDVTLSSCDRPESMDEFLKFVSFEVFSPNAIIIEGLGSYAHGFPMPDGCCASPFYPYKRVLWDKEYAACTTENVAGHCDTLIIATSDNEALKAKEVYDERIKLQVEEMNKDFEKADAEYQEFIKKQNGAKIK